MNGNLKWIMGILSGVLVLVIVGWISNTSGQVQITDRKVAVLETQMTAVNCSLVRIESMVGEIRADQMRRARMEISK